MLAAVRVVRRSSETVVEPFGDAPGVMPVLAGTLAEAQTEAVQASGCEWVDAPPRGEAYILVSDRVWFTASLLKAMIATGRPGRLVVTDQAFLRVTGALQSDPAHPELAIVPADHPPTFDDLPDLSLDLGLKAMPAQGLHPAFAHAAADPLVAGACAVHGIEHWSHLVRVNLLALSARVAEAKDAFDSAAWWSKVGTALAILWKAGRLNEAALARAVTRMGKGCKVHPTAVVEACELGNDVKIGAGAVLRGCVVGDGASIDAQAHCVASAIGAGAQIGRGAHLALSVLFPGALVSQGAGFQACVFGRDSFVAQGVTALDLSFGRPISVDHRGERVSSGGWFLGCAVGHRARIGAGVRIGYGVAIPNDTLLVGPPDTLLRTILPVDGPAMVRDGRLVSVKDGM